jgi:hypothetical protein
MNKSRKEAITKLIEQARPYVGEFDQMLVAMAEQMDAEENAFDALPEGLQTDERSDILEQVRSFHSYLETIKDSLESLVNDGDDFIAS